jgi:fatty-acyl-CoA synthase
VRGKRRNTVLEPTETGPVSFQSFTDTPLDDKVSSVGLVHPNVEAKVVDRDGNMVPRGV